MRFNWLKARSSSRSSLLFTAKFPDIPGRVMPVLSNLTFLSLVYFQGASVGVFYKVGISLLLGHGFILGTIGV